VRRRIGRLIVVGALVIVALVPACGRGDDITGPHRAVTIGDLQHKQYFYQGEYLGRRVTVSAAVSDVLGPRVFELSGGDFGDEKLQVVTDAPVEVSKDQVVRVTGTVGQLKLSAPSERVPYIQENLYAKYETKAYLYDATLERPHA
jgi:hypothetical protein